MKSNNKNHRRLHILTSKEFEPLNWIGLFKYPNMVRLKVIADGSCFFHAIAKSYLNPYIMEELNGEYFDRSKFIRELRRDLSIKLGAKIDPSNPKSLRPYDTLSRGELSNFSKTVKSYTLQNMQRELNSTNAVDNVYNEFISNELNKDIYILDMAKQDVYVTGSDDDILYKNRPSIVLLYLPGHYELVGIDDGEDIKTLFDPNDEFIKAIRNRMKIARNRK